MKRSTCALLLAACVLYLGIRIYWLSQAFDQLVFPMYELYPSGAFARLFQLGLDQPLGIHYDNSGGALINGLLAAPLYELFGSSYLVYKLIPLFLGLLLLIFVFFGVRGLVGEAAALAAAYLFAMGPTELLQKYSLIGTGNHFENLFYMTLVLWAFDAAHRKGCTPRRLFLLGLAAGLNLFVILAAVIPVGCMLGAHVLVRGLRGAAHDLRYAGPGLALGLFPLVWMNFYVSPRGLHFLAAKFAGESGEVGGASIASRFWTFLSEDLLRAPFHGDTHPVLGWGFLVLWLFCLLFLGLPLIGRSWNLLRGLGRARGERASRAAYEQLKFFPLVLWTPLAALAFALSNLANGKHAYPLEVGGYRYFLPHFFLLQVMLVAVVARPEWKQRARLGWGLVCLLGLLGLQPLRAVWAAGQFEGAGTHYEGFSFVQYARGFVMHSSGVSRDQAIVWASKLPDQEARCMHRGLGFYHAQLAMAGDVNGDGQVDSQERERRKQQPKDAVRMNLETLLAGVPLEYQIDWCRGAGAGLRTLAGYRSDEVGAIRETLVGLARAGDERVVHVLEGICWKQAYAPLARRVPHLARRAGEVARALGEADLGSGSEGETLRAGAGRALGIFMGRLLAREYEPEVELLRSLFTREFPIHGRALLEGLGIGLADSRSRVVWPALSMDRIVPGADQVLVAAALGDECRRISTARFQEALGVVPAELRKAVEGER